MRREKKIESPSQLSRLVSLPGSQSLSFSLTFQCLDPFFFPPRGSDLRLFRRKVCYSFHSPSLLSTRFHCSNLCVCDVKGTGDSVVHFQFQVISLYLFFSFSLFLTLHDSPTCCECVACLELCMSMSLCSPVRPRFPHSFVQSTTRRQSGRGMIFFVCECNVHIYRSFFHSFIALPVPPFTSFTFTPSQLLFIESLLLSATESGATLRKKDHSFSHRIPFSDCEPESMCPESNCFQQLYTPCVRLYPKTPTPHPLMKLEDRVRELGWLQWTENCVRSLCGSPFPSQAQRDCNNNRPVKRYSLHKDP